MICDHKPDFAEVLGERLEAEEYRVLVVHSTRGVLSERSGELTRPDSDGCPIVGDQRIRRGSEETDRPFGPDFSS